MKTLFITGVSSGLGRAFASGALAAGHQVIGTVRKPEDAVTFERLAPGRAHGRVLDVTDDAAVVRTVAGAESAVGAIDVVIANAGYGVEGVFEETPLSQMRAQFATNVFGVAATLQAALPYMRQRRAGHLMAVTSMGGLMAVPGMSAYCASKFAVEGLLESVRKEVASFGINVTAIEPGSFRTDWAGRSMTRAERFIPDYDELFEAVTRRFQMHFSRGHWFRANSPAKQAAKIGGADVPAAGFARIDTLGQSHDQSEWDGPRQVREGNEQ